MDMNSLVGECGLNSRQLPCRPLTTRIFASSVSCPPRHTLRNPQQPSLLSIRGGLPLLANPHRRATSKLLAAPKNDADVASASSSKPSDSSEGSSSNSASGASETPSSDSSPSTTSMTSPSNSNSESEQPKPSPPPRRSGQSWLSKLASIFTSLSPFRLIINIAVFTFLMRFLPMPGVSSSPLSQPDGVVLRISFSEFIRSVRKNEVSRVVVDGTHLMYALNPTASMFKGPLKNLGIDQNKITFETVRPTDYPTPYDTMITNNVQISALEKRGGLFGTLLVGWLCLFIIIYYFLVALF